MNNQSTTEDSGLDSLIASRLRIRKLVFPFILTGLFSCTGLIPLFINHPGICNKSVSKERSATQQDLLP